MDVMAITNPFALEAAALTDPGCLRLDNQDSVFIENPPPDHLEFACGLLAIVADGMGGHRGGAVASALAIDVVAATVRAWPLTAAPTEVLANALAAANTAVYERAQADAELEGMGTTLSAVMLRGGSLYGLHVGDSRIYRMRGDSIEQLSVDHTLVQSMLDAGLLAPEEAANHPDRNVVVRAVGTKPTTEYDLWRSTEPPAPGDVLLLCSDGLHDVVSSDDILRLVRGVAPGEACARLVDAARQAGGPDNISAIVMVVHVEDGSLTAEPDDTQLDTLSPIDLP